MRRHSSLSLALLLAVGACLAAAVYAQETQVPLDEGGRITVIDGALEERLGLFPEYKGFTEARLFQGPDSTFKLEIIYRPDSQVQRASRSLTSAEVRALRARVTAAIRITAPRAGLDQSGRSAFLISTALLSLGYYGWAVPYGLNVDDGRAYGGAYMLTSGLGFFGPFFLTRHRSVTDAEATLSFYGATRGILHGWCVGALVLGEDREARESVVAGMLGSLAEYGTGFWVASKTGMSAGTVETMSAVGDFGIAIGWWAHFLADRHNEKLQASAMLAGSGAGLVTGNLLARARHYTRGDAYVLRAAGDLGAYVGFATSASIIEGDNDDEKPVVASVMAGSIAGLGVGHHLIRGKDFTTGQGVIVNIGEVAGGLLAAGLLYITGADTDPVWPYMAASSAGAAAGFWLTYRSLGDRAAADGSRSSEDKGSGGLSRVRIGIRPEGLLACGLVGTKASGRLGQAGRPLPILQLQYRF